ncbi:MAG: DUF1573 domain-containing protein [Bacteroidetes bacterium]|nr:DUF1573 domain-containing protein [Bacteroidota bacterium]
MQRRWMVLLPLLAATAWGQPKLSLDRPEIDLGVVYRGAVKKAKFTLKNIGNEPLKILQMVPSCGCTALKRPKEVLAPGESDVIEVEFSSATFRGRVESKRVDIQTNDPTAEYATVMLTADVREELAPVQGSSLAWFGAVPLGKPSDYRLVFKNVTDRPIGIRGFKAPTGRVTVKWNKARIASQEDVEFTITLTPDREGYTSDHVDIEIDSRNQPIVQVSVMFIGQKNPS